MNVDKETSAPVVGIVAEFNPFHRGHAYLIEEIRRRCGPDTGIVCAMSGQFVQRGEAAIFPKYTRAAAALAGGANLIFELPLPWAIASAEGFAQGAVWLLGASGVLTHLCFGSESGDLDLLQRAAAVLRDSRIDTHIRAYLQQGISYPAARQRAWERLTGQDGSFLSEPNHILGIAYLQALASHNFNNINNKLGEITPMTVRREGSWHDGVGSASDIRRMLLQGTGRPEAYVPPACWEIYKKSMADGAGPVGMEALEIALLSRLRQLPQAAFSQLPDASEGLGDRLFHSVAESCSWEETLSRAKTRRYTHARLRRMLLCSCLGVQKAPEDLNAPPYLRVLAADERGRQLLRRMRQTSQLPVIGRAGEARRLGGSAEALMEREAAATDLYVLGCPQVHCRRAGQEWRSAPEILKKSLAETGNI